MIKIKPKFIKKASLWLVHTITPSVSGMTNMGKKEIQKMEWFETEKKALEFYNKVNE